jgi:hypothetical protein
MMALVPVVPRLEPLMDLTVNLAPPWLVGTVTTGERRIVPIAGGRFEGARLRGEILPGGADWQIVATDGTAMLEARYTLKTEDGALIYVRNVGVRHGPAEVLAAIARGEEVDPSKYYFRASPVFETGAERYAWLNRLVAVCSGVRTRDAVLLNFYAVT